MIKFVSHKKYYFDSIACINVMGGWDRFITQNFHSLFNFLQFIFKKMLEITK